MGFFLLSCRNYLCPTFSTKNASLRFIETRLKGHGIHSTKGTNIVHFLSAFLRRIRAERRNRRSKEIKRNRTGAGESLTK